MDGTGFTDESVDPYAAALSAAEGSCTQGPESIGDIVVRGSQVAQEQSINVSILELLRAIPASVPATARPTDCTGVAAYLVLRKG